MEMFFAFFVSLLVGLSLLMYFSTHMFLLQQLGRKGGVSTCCIDTSPLPIAFQTRRGLCRMSLKEKGVSLEATDKPFSSDACFLQDRILRED